jgi:VCBS repeat protein
VPAYALAIACAWLLHAAAPAPAATVTLNPEADTWVSSDAPTAAHGADATMEIGGFGTAADRRAYLRFNGSIPAGAVVTRTTLRVFFDNAPAGNFDLRLATPANSSWNEASVTWNTPPPVPSGPVSGDITSITAGYNNLSVPLLRPGTPITYILTRAAAEGAQIQAREGASKPELVVEYEVPGTASSSACSPIGCLESLPWVTTMSWGIVVEDFNRDGRDDFLVTRHESNQDQLQLQQADGSFAPGFHLDNGDRHGCTAGDVNGDGRPDIYCMLGADGGEGLGLKRDELWIARPDGTYADEAEAWGVTNTNGRGRRPLLFDFTRDGRPDLYVTNFNPGPGGAAGNGLYVNVGGTRFEERTVSASGDRGAACVDDGDWDRDGYRDFLVCGSELNLFHNNGGLDTETVPRNSLLDTPVAFPQDATLADVNGDGWDDVVVVTRTLLQVRLNLGPGNPNPRFAVSFTTPLTDGKSVSVGDLTGDGHQDVYVVEGVQSGGSEGPRNVPDKLFIGPVWSQLLIPPARVGTGDGSELLTVDGRRGLIVTNGRDFARGPVQLISFRPASAPALPSPPPPPGSSPPPTPPVDAAQPAGAAQPALPRAADVVLLPSTRRCAARRGVRIRINQPAGLKLGAVDVFVNRKRVRMTSRKLTAPIHLRALPKRRFTIRVVVTTADGRKLSRSARYRPCAGGARR